MELKKYINIDELIILNKMKKSFSINGFNELEFLDIIYKDNIYYCTFVSKDNLTTVFEFNNFIELKSSLSKYLKNIFFNRTTLTVWNNVTSEIKNPLN